MKRVIILAFVLVLSVTVYAEDLFNEYGVWTALSNITITTGATRSAGPVDMTRGEKYFNFFIYSANDSMWTKLDVYGMMTYLKSDTTKSTLISTNTEYTGDHTTTFSDSLENASAFPYLFIKLTNMRADSSVTCYVYGYSRPTQKTILQLR